MPIVRILGIKSLSSGKLSCDNTLGFRTLLLGLTVAPLWAVEAALDVDAVGALGASEAGCSGCAGGGVEGSAVGSTESSTAAGVGVAAREG